MERDVDQHAKQSSNRGEGFEKKKKHSDLDSSKAGSNGEESKAGVDTLAPLKPFQPPRRSSVDSDSAPRSGSMRRSLTDEQRARFARRSRRASVDQLAQPLRDIHASRAKATDRLSRGGSLTRGGSLKEMKGSIGQLRSDLAGSLRRYGSADLASESAKTLKVPSGDVTIIYTDVQGSTSLWEAAPLDMKKATDIHDSIMRKCYAEHSGYEITTEGDAFNLAFQHPVDAIGFALKAQLALYSAWWPDGILDHPDGCESEKKMFRGFRVRFGMHHGPTTSRVHTTTGRTTYRGEAVDIAKAIEKISHGGQILTTVETWRAVSGMGEKMLEKPQVIDCGEHLLYDPKKKKGKRRNSWRIVQLVPNLLAYDYFEARQVHKDGPPPQICGRRFPPQLSFGQVSTSFLNAPYAGNKVTIVFVYTDKMETATSKERKKNHRTLAKHVRAHLMRLSPPGYECQEDKGSWMLAFDSIENGVKFALDLKEDVLREELLGEVDSERVFRIGLHWGPFISMGPHTVSGHADYFGPIGEKTSSPCPVLSLLFHFILAALKRCVR